MTEPAKTMVVGGRRFIEVKPANPAHPIGGVCMECALGKSGMLRHCGSAVFGEAERAFGGDCLERDVIYAEVS